MRKALTPGTRVRAKVRTMSGWKGTGTITCDCMDTVTLTKDGWPVGGDEGEVLLCRDEVAVLRDQTPPTPARILELVIKRLLAVEGMSLTAKGVSIPDEHATPDEVSRRRDDQASMFTDEAMEQFATCRRYITESLGPQDYMGKLMSSFYLTQLAGEWSGKPVSNGMLCAAAIAEGYVPCHVEGYGCWFYVAWDRVDEIRQATRFLCDAV
jgi:hypothetical protein